MGGEPAKRKATYEDLLQLPDHVVGELIHGVLHAMPRPASRHARASSLLGLELSGPFDRGRGGPGGWVILDEPELHLPGGHVLVPDLAGWRRERMPEMPDVAAFEIALDWVCEVLSPSTAAIDRADKLPLYASWRVGHVWLVDPGPKTLEVLRLDGATYRLVVTHAGEVAVRAEPFDAVAIDLGALWSR